jgi:tetratricopeptide (TPR) repeat protein
MSKKSIVVLGLLLALLIFCVVVIINVRSESAEYYLNRAENFFKEGQYEKAIPEFEKVIELTPKNADLYIALGLCYHSLGQYQEAIVQYKEAITIDPEHANAYSNLGYAYGTLGQSDKEKTYLIKAKKLFQLSGDRANVEKIDTYFKYLEQEKYLDQR